MMGFQKSKNILRLRAFFKEGTVYGKRIYSYSGVSNANLDVHSSSDHDPDVHIYIRSKPSL